jgi:GR25 family glycosyltransferase involved in LPS biosynthesis
MPVVVLLCQCLLISQLCGWFVKVTSTPSSRGLPKLYYINLDRRPDRREFMEGQFEKEEVHEAFEIIRFPAIDGKFTTLPESALAMFQHADFKNKYNFGPLVANQLSHYTLWMRIKANTDEFGYALIFQDDAALKTNFVEEVRDLIDHMPEDTAVVWLGMHGFADRAFSIPMMIEENYDPNSFSKPIENNSHVGIATQNACSLAYIITKKGVSEIMEYFNKYGFYRATDRVMNDALTQAHKNYIARRILCTGDASFISDSDIFEESDTPASAPYHKENFLKMYSEYSKAKMLAKAMGMDIETLVDMVQDQQQEQQQAQQQEDDEVERQAQQQQEQEQVDKTEEFQDTQCVSVQT